MRQQGSIFKRTPKSKTRTLVYYKPDGTQKWESGFKTKTDAIKRRDEVLGQLRDGSYFEPTDITFGEFSDEWLPSRISIKGSTYENYECYLRAHVKPVIGSMKLTDIRLETIEALVQKLMQKKIGKDRTLSPNTIGKIIVMTRTIFKAAIRKKKIRFNPAQEVELPTVIKKKVQPPSKADVLKVLEESSPERRTVYLLDVMTGLRRGEVLGLQWRDIDWLSHELIVQRAICKFRSTDGVHKYVYGLGTTKNKKLRRVALPPTVYQALQNLYQTAQNQAPDSFLFTRKGTFINPEYFTKWMTLPFLKKGDRGASEAVP